MCAQWLDDDVRTLHAMGAKYGSDFPVNLVKLMAHESGCSPAAVNWIYERDPGGKIIGKHAGTVGLVQFEADTLKGLGWHGTQEAFAALSVAQQLPYVDRYLSPHRDAIQAGGLGVLYTVVFLPALAAKSVDQTFVLCASHGPLAWAYASNFRDFDVDRKGWITPLDLVHAAEAFYAKTPAAIDLATRVAALDEVPDTQPEAANVIPIVSPTSLLNISGGSDPDDPEAA